MKKHLLFFIILSIISIISVQAFWGIETPPPMIFKDVTLQTLIDEDPNITSNIYSTANISVDWIYASNMNVSGNITFTNFKTMNVTGDILVYGNITLDGFHEGSVLFINENGTITEKNDHFFYDSSNGGSFAVGSNSQMRNIIQAVKDEGITNVNNVKALIAVLNTETVNGNWVGYTMQTLDVAGNRYSVGRIMGECTSHAEDNVTGDIMFETRHEGTRHESMRIKGDGNIGIGTSTPTAKLDINGTVNMKGTLVNNSGFGIFINDTCIVFGNLSYISECS